MRLPTRQDGVENRDKVYVCLRENRLIDINVMQSHCQFAN